MRELHGLVQDRTSVYCGMPVLQLVSWTVHGRGNRLRIDLGVLMAKRLDIDEYMTKLQEVTLKFIDHKKLRNDDIMFRAVEVKHLVPRFRIEIGVVIEGRPIIASTMRERDPEITGMKLAQYVNELLGNSVAA